MITCKSAEMSSLLETDIVFTEKKNIHEHVLFSFHVKNKKIITNKLSLANRLHFCCGGFGKVFIYLHMIDSMTSSAPPPMDNRRKSL